MINNSQDQLSFKNKVVIVTGAGRGLGLEYCRVFAQRGAKVVVNDLDTTRDGNQTIQNSSSYKPLAVQVAESLEKEFGIEAIGNTDSVLDADRIVDATVKRFGTVHILINNAGILRDKSFANMTQEDWDRVYQVHMLAAFRMTKAVWPHMKQQSYGRIVFASSPAGIYGSFGQANYSAMKSGLIGLTKTLAIEGRKNNIFVNAIAPLAATRMSDGVIPGIEIMDASKIAPLVVFLSHDSMQQTGQLFECAGGWIGTLRWEKSEGVRIPENTPEAVSKEWKKILDFSKNTSHPSNGTESIMEIVQKSHSSL